jgi:cell division protein FtsW
MVKKSKIDLIKNLFKISYWKKMKKPDFILSSTIFLIIIVGIVILASASMPYSATYTQKVFGETKPFHFLGHQLLYGFLPGIILGFIGFKLKIDTIKKFAPFLLLANVVLLIMVFLPVVGTGLKGASRWVNLGFVSVQPSEFLKLSFILYLSSWLASRTKEKKKHDKFLDNNFISFFVIVGLICLLLVLQPDVSTMTLIFCIGITLYFLAGTNIFQTALVGGLGVVGLGILIKLAPYRLERLMIFLDPSKDPMGSGYQLKQSLIAIGSGEIFGRGLGMSVQKFGFIPEPLSDSIFSIFAEETGFIGAFLLLVLFGFFFWNVLRVGKQAKDKFQSLVVWGIGLWLMIQTFVNIGSMVGVMPLTGIPLPFISYGGSAMITELAAIGILLNISKEIKS